MGIDKLLILVYWYNHVAILNKRLKIDLTLYTILQILSLTPFEKVSLLQLLKMTSYQKQIDYHHIQLKLFDS